MRGVLQLDTKGTMGYLATSPVAWRGRDTYTLRICVTCSTVMFSREATLILQLCVLYQICDLVIRILCHPKTHSLCPPSMG